MISLPGGATSGCCEADNVFSVYVGSPEPPLASPVLPSVDASKEKAEKHYGVFSQISVGRTFEFTETLLPARDRIENSHSHETEGIKAERSSLPSSLLSPFAAAATGCAFAAPAAEAEAGFDKLEKRDLSITVCEGP